MGEIRIVGPGSLIRCARKCSKKKKKKKETLSKKKKKKKKKRKRKKHCHESTWTVGLIGCFELLMCRKTITEVIMM